MAMRIISSTNGAGADVYGEPERGGRPALPMTIEGPREELANEIAELSPEGRPAHPHAGPGALLSGVALVIGLFVLIAFGLSWWLGWYAGVAMLAIGALAIVFNPAVLANLHRVRERGVIAGRHNAPEGSSPTATVVRTTDIDSRKD